MPQSIAFLGLGNMGFPMAQNILRSHGSLYVWNRSHEKAAPLINQAATLLQSPSEAFEKARIVITMLANDKALNEVVFGKNGLMQSIKPGCIHISMSTVSPETSAKLEAAHKEKGAFFLAAPVFGRPDVAAAAKLWIAVAGNPEAKAEVEPILKMMGQRVENFGDDPKTANVVKLSGNFLILTVAASLGEVCALAESNGIDKLMLMNFFSETLFPSPVYKTYGTIVATQAFEPPGFTMTLGLKDLNLVRATAEHSNVQMPIATTLLNLLQKGIEEGRENLDWSAISLSSNQNEKLPQ